MIAVLETAQAAQAAPAPAAAAPAPPAAAPAAKAPAGAQPSLREALTSTLASLDADLHAEVLVLGAGPGGYTAAFRAADLGKKVVLVERYATLGGVCLNVGCIPSKALLHAAKVIADAEDMAHHGVTFGKPAIDLDGVRKFKDGVVAKLTKGLASLAKARKVTVVAGPRAVRLARTRWRWRRRKGARSSPSTTASSPPARSRRRSRACPTTTRASWTPRARSS